MPDELPDAVFTELGRLTWSAIHLEDLSNDQNLWMVFGLVT